MSAWDNFYGTPSTSELNVQTDGVGTIPCSVFQLDSAFVGVTGDDPERLDAIFLAELVTLAQSESGKFRVIKQTALLVWRGFNDPNYGLSLLKIEPASSMGVGLDEIASAITVSNSATVYSVNATVSGCPGETISWHTSLTVRFWAPLFS